MTEVNSAVIKAYKYDIDFNKDFWRHLCFACELGDLIRYAIECNSPFVLAIDGTCVFINKIVMFRRLGVVNLVKNADGSVSEIIRRSQNEIS